MGGSTDRTGLDRLAAQLTLRAVQRHDVPRDIAADAATITMRRLGSSLDPRDPAGVRRAEAYFWGVVRRGALQGASGTSRLRERYVTATIARDLASAGHGPDRVFAAIERDFGARVASDAVSSVFSSAAVPAGGVA